MDFRAISCGSPNREFPPRSSSPRYPMRTSNFVAGSRGSSLAARALASARPAASPAEPFLHLPCKASGVSTPSSTSSTCRLGGSSPPTQYLLPSPPSSSLVKHNHQSTAVPSSPDSIFRKLKHHLRQQSHLPLQPQRLIVIEHVSPDDFDKLLAKHAEATILKSVKLEYCASLCQIVVCSPPPPYHGCMPLFLQEALFSLRGSPFDTAERQRTLGVREISFRSRDGSQMVPDAAVVVLDVSSAESVPRLYPTIVVEVANTQLYENAVDKIKRWFVKSRNTVEVALLLRFTEDPLINPTCFLEIFRCRPSGDDAGGAGDDLIAELDLDSSDDGFVGEDETSALGDDGADNMERDDGGKEGEGGDDNGDFGGDELPHISNDHSISSASLNDSDSSLSSVHEEHVANPGNAAPIDVDGSNSPHSASDPACEPDEDISVLSPHLDNSAPDSDPIPSYPSSPFSASSNNSRAAYYPVTEPRPHRLEMYLAGPRKTVLPVADPPDPEMRYLVLRYSDFFGSENVPAGRHAGEEVRLDLDLLREQVAGLIRLTREQVGNVRKRTKAGGSAGKRVKR